MTEKLRHHLMLKPLGDDRYECECGQEGTLPELRKLDCPKGKAPHYAPDVEDRIVLVEEETPHYVKRFVVHLLDYYDRDPNFERARALQGKPRADVLRRLGAIRGSWTAHSLVDGVAIGSVESADHFVKKLGIAPQGRDANSRICSIGFCEREQKWYGWSHRAIHGFGIGHVAEAGDAHTESGYTPEYLAEHPEKDVKVPVGFECKTLDDCKRCAIAFAESVG